MWITFWGWLLALAVVVFSGLAVVVAIGGFFDIRSLFRQIDSQHRSEEADQEENG